VLWNLSDAQSDFAHQERLTIPPNNKRHKYVLDFMNDKTKMEIVKKSGVVISIGSDCHRCEEYNGSKLYETYDFLKREGFKTIDEFLS
jgi:hypothetical protein